MGRKPPGFKNIMALAALVCFVFTSCYIGAPKRGWAQTTLGSKAVALKAPLQKARTAQDLAHDIIVLTQQQNALENAIVSTIQGETHFRDMQTLKKARFAELAVIVFRDIWDDTEKLLIKDLVSRYSYEALLRIETFCATPPVRDSYSALVSKTKQKSLNDYDKETQNAFLSLWQDEQIQSFFDNGFNPYLVQPRIEIALFKALDQLVEES